jgi:hypothetical protein
MQEELLIKRIAIEGMEPGRNDLWNLANGIAPEQYLIGDGKCNNRFMLFPTLHSL